ncbi:MAG: DUF2181 domain-containing protein [Ktedonobacteraceae bacterium]|nr:DUF2181 domain-containing protein [Ktedonobacteraceae bacterium]
MQSVIAYFQQYHAITCAGDLTWAHAVNSREKLKVALHNSQVMIVESDILRTKKGEIIAAHPPENQSDLNFERLLEAIAAFPLHGLKLDFKDPAAVLPCLERLRDCQLQQPVLLNADILTANGAVRSPFNPAEFLELCCHLYPRGLLSIGWTTRHAPLSSYTRKNIEEMLALCEQYALRQVTFPVRASLLPSGWQHVARLLWQEGYTLTIWSGGPLEKRLQDWLRRYTSPARTCYDCTDEQGWPFRVSSYACYSAENHT